MSDTKKQNLLNKENIQNIKIDYIMHKLFLKEQDNWPFD